jgi:tetratricopeptide (TPR) repeat protein
VRVTILPKEFQSKESRSPGAPQKGGSFPTLIAVVVLAIAIGAVYQRALRVPFIFDDVVGVKQNLSIVSLWPLVGTANNRGPLNPLPNLPTAGRPLVNLSFALNYAIGGDHPAGYHAVNIVIHFLAALLLWAIVNRTLRLPYFGARFASSSSWLALAAALLWALHPLHTETVVYVTQRTELMMATFFLATLYCSLRYWTGNFHRSLWLSLAVLASLCGMASKEVMVLAPIMVLLFERTFIEGTLAKALRRSWPLYVGLASTWLLLLALNIGAPRGNSAGFGYGPPLFTWWLTQTHVILIYLRLIFWPYPLLIHYQLPYLESFAEGWVYAAPILLLGIGTLVLLWKNKPLGYAGCWVFALLAPTSVVPVLTEMGAERRMYLPLAAIATWVVVAAYVLVKRLDRGPDGARWTLVRASLPAWVMAVFVLVVVLASGVVSAKRLPAFDDELKLWADVLRYQPDSYYAHMSKGTLLEGRGRRQEAIEELRAAAALNPDHPVALNNLGLAFKTVELPEEAVAMLHSALQMFPAYPEARHNLAATLDDMNRFPEAIEQHQLVLRLRPDDAATHNNLGNTLTRAGRLPEAIAAFEVALELNDKDPHVHSNMANALTHMGRYQEAIDHCQQAVKLRGDCFDVRVTLGTALMHTGRIPEAIEEIRSGIALRPEEATGYNTLGAALLHLGQYSEAKEQFEHALAIEPEYAVARNNLGQALSRLGQLAEAIEQFRLATEQDASFAAPQLSWAYVLATHDKFDDSIEHFEKAIALGANRADVHNSLGDSYRKSGKNDKAIEHYRIAVQLNPAFLPASANLAQTLALGDRSEEAIAVSEKAIQIARSTGQQDELGQFEKWLKHYQIELRRAAEAAAVDQSPSPAAQQEQTQ